MSTIRFRNVFLVLGIALALIASFIWDPLKGDLTIDWLIRSTRFFLAVAAVFFGFRAVSDYDEADGQRLHAEAIKTSVGAGMALVYRGLAMIAMAIIAAAILGGPAYAAGIPTQAMQYLPVLKSLQQEKWPGHPMPEILAGQIEHESGCFSMPKKCWNPKSQLKTPREEGAGFPQLTRAYYASGKLRFDSLAEMKAKHADLKELSWNNVYVRPDLQLLVVVLKNRDNWVTFRSIKNIDARIKTSLKAYNRGVGGVLAEMRACQRQAGCNVENFAQGVGKTCTASWTPIYGKQSPCSISLRYVPDIVDGRSPKYRALMG